MTDFAFENWKAKAKAVRIEDELARRGITLKGRGANRAGPCPMCGGRDRFGVNIKKGVWSCRGCGVGGDAIDLVRHLDGSDFIGACITLVGPLWATSGSPKRPPQRRPMARGKRRGDPDEHDADQHRKAGWLWSQRRPITGTPAEIYLRKARGITIALPATLAYLAPIQPGWHPALIAAFAIVDEIEAGALGAPSRVEAVHLTLLKPDGSGKADTEKPKMFVGSQGALPIVIAPPNDLLGLAITEGIEDALSVHQATNLGTWAAGSADRLQALADVVPVHIEAVTIIADTDEDGKGQRNSSALAEKLKARGFKEIRIEGSPPCR